MEDQALSFFFKKLPVRGHICRLQNSISNALNYHQTYPDFAKRLLGEIAAITQCFTMDVKDGNFHGTLQITGNGPLKMALVDAHSTNSYRACATFNDSSVLEANPISLPAAFGDKSQLVLTIDISENRYQTVVGLTGENLETTLQHYFVQSQQIPTIVLCKSSVTNDNITAGALILQKMPDHHTDSDDLWHEIAVLTSTLKESELLDNELPLKEILYRLYNQHDLIVSRETIPTFKCSCSLEKIKNVLSMLEPNEKSSSPQNVNCEFCGRTYILDL